MHTSCRLAAVFAFILLAGCAREPIPAAPTHAAVPAPTPQAGDPVEGLRVVTRVGCTGCHAADGGGKVFNEDKEQGLIVAPNLTHRRDLYNDAGLAALLHEGKTHDGHVPWGMPIQMFQHLSDREVRDIIAWLRSIPAVDTSTLPEGKWSDALSKQIKDGTHPWLEDMRPAPGNVPPAAPPTERLALGKHLALTSCPECHAADLNGYEGDDAPSLIVAKAYSPEAFKRLMRTGVTATGRESKTGLMSRMARDRFHVLTDDEIAALKLYLDSR